MQSSVTTLSRWTILYARVLARLCSAIAQWIAAHVSTALAIVCLWHLLQFPFPAKGGYLSPDLKNTMRDD
jgi:hypothetical protein